MKEGNFQGRSAGRRGGSVGSRVLTRGGPKRKRKFLQRCYRRLLGGVLLSSSPLKELYSHRSPDRKKGTGQILAWKKIPSQDDPMGCSGERVHKEDAKVVTAAFAEKGSPPWRWSKSGNRKRGPCCHSFRTFVQGRDRSPLTHEKNESSR